MVIIVQAAKDVEALKYFQAFERVLDSGLGFTEAVVVDADRFQEAPLGARCLFDHEGNYVADWNGPEMGEVLEDWLTPLADRPRPGVKGGVALLPTLPRIRLVIVGAGHVGQAVGNLAAQADFDVWVVDDRAQYANRERFPAAENLIVGPIEDVLSKLDVDERTYGLIVTRGHGHDQEALFHLATTSAAYVGLIGSRRKIKLIFESLREAGVPEASLARVAAPVGIDIGSQTVIEIAVSIVAELIARRNLGTGQGAIREVSAAVDGCERS
jgi:xanthine dehydrogenase accessory factor